MSKEYDKTFYQVRVLKNPFELNRLDKEDLAILEDIINTEIDCFLDSGYMITSEYIIKLRKLLKKLNLKEIYDFDVKYKCGAYKPYKNIESEITII